MLGAGDIKNPCKCAGCSLQKAAIYVAMFFFIAHGVFVFGLYYLGAFNLFRGTKDNEIYKLAAYSTGFEGDSDFFPTKVKSSSNTIQNNQRLILTVYLATQYIGAPFPIHCVLFYGALKRSYSCSYIWIIYTWQYLVTDAIFKFYLFSWYFLLYTPFWLFDIYCIWVLKRFKEEIVLYGKIALPRQVVKCPYYFDKPKNYDPKSNFIST